MYEYLDDFFRFWSTITVEQFIRYFWFFFLFDLLRYLVTDVLVVAGLDKIRKYGEKSKYDAARKRLFEELPLVSVIAPGKNEGKHIPALAKSMRSQTYNNLEIIVVDDGSDDNTPEILRKTFKEGLIDNYFRNDIRGGKASAANLALRYTKGKFIVHLDADSHLLDDAVEKIIIPFYMDDEIGAVGGDIAINNTEESLAAALQGIEYAKSISIGRRITSYFGVMRIISGAFGAFRKDLLNRLGGWDVGPGLDGDITFKHRKIGYKVLFEAESICMTNCPVLFKKLAKQRYRWDRSLVRFRLRKHMDLLLPQANFQFRNFVAATDNIFYNFILNINWWVYIIDLLSNFPHLLKYLIPVNYVLFAGSNLLQYLLYIMITKHGELRRKSIRLLIFIPLMPFYTGLFLRFVRTYAYIMELLFKKSYEDPWNPWKVSKVVRDKKL